MKIFQFLFSTCLVKIVEGKLSERPDYIIFTSSSSQIFYRIGLLKVSQKFTGKHLCWSYFFIKLQKVTPLLQRVTSDFLQRAASVTSNKRILQRVTNDFLQRAISATSNEWLLQGVTSDFLQRPTSATSNERILERVTSDFTTSNEQRVNCNE